MLTKRLVYKYAEQPFKIVVKKINNSNSHQLMNGETVICTDNGILLSNTKEGPLIHTPA